jgi:hypothetical protein
MRDTHPRLDGETNVAWTHVPDPEPGADDNDSPQRPVSSAIGAIVSHRLSTFYSE